MVQKSLGLKKCCQKKIDQKFPRCFLIKILVPPPPICWGRGAKLLALYNPTYQIWFSCSCGSYSVYFILLRLSVRIQFYRYLSQTKLGNMLSKLGLSQSHLSDHSSYHLSCYQLFTCDDTPTLILPVMPRKMYNAICFVLS